MTASETLIVVAAFDHRFDHNLEGFKGGPLVRMDTSEGGHPSAAFIRAYRENPDFHSYLFLQDSLEAHVDDVVAPFRDPMRMIVAWGLFPFFFDNQEQADWVMAQYPGGWLPEHGIFGPIFYATRKALEALDGYNLFPATPSNRIEAQGTERAWALAFFRAGLKVNTLGWWSNEEMSSGNYPVFRKTFAARP